jgi:glycosyltransferase involved in cell wall biosynthesis
MRILIIHSQYRSGSVSGENRVVDDEARLLADGGHDVLAWTPSPHSISGLRAGARAVWSHEAARRVRALARMHRADVIHFHNLFPMVSPAALRAATAEAPTVLTLHNYRFLCLPATLLRDGSTCESCVGRGPWRGVAHRCYRNSFAASGALAGALALHRRLGTFARISAFLAVSEFVRSRYVEAGFPGRILLKPNFVFPTRPRAGAGDFFLYIGRVSAEKGLGDLIEAWRGLPDRLVIAGEGPDAARLAEAAPPGVEFIGAVAPDRIGELLTHTRALVAPSAWAEPAPRAAIEAHAAGVPVIASRVGGLPEIVEDGLSGILVPAGDPAAIRSAVERLRADADSERLGRAALVAWRRRFSPEVALRALEAAYAEALR